MRRPAPGSFPDTFDERIRRCRCAPGEIGQYINTAHSMTSVGCREYQDRMGWPIDHLADRCVFDWAAGDGQNPAIGPTLDLVYGGGPVETDPSPWVDMSGHAIASAHFDGTQARGTATQVTPTAGQDVRVLMLASPQNDRAAANIRVISTRDAGEGININYQASNERWRTYVEDNAGATTVNSTPFSAWSLLDAHWDLDGQLTVYCNGIVGSAAAPGGAHQPWDGVGIGSEPGGGAAYFLGRIARLLMYFGAGLENAADHNEICAFVFGARDWQSNGIPTTTRGSPGCCLSGTSYHLIGVNAPRAGGTEGLLIEQAATNKVYNNINVQNTNGWAATGGAMAAVDDTAALRASGIFEWGPQVHRFVPGGGPQIMYGGVTTGNLNPHSISVWIRGAAGGESVDVGVRDISAGTFQNVQTVTCTTTYQKVTLHGFVPGDTDRQFGLDCDAGDTVYHIGAHMEESFRCSSPIPNLSEVAAATRALDDFVTADDPDDNGGSIELTIEPVGWSAAQYGGGNLLFETGVGVGTLFVNGAGNWEATIDGTTALDSTIQPVDGTPYRIRLRWVLGGQQSIEVWNGTTLLSRVASAYDGTLQGAGTWELAPGMPVLATNLRTYRNGSG